jgi:tripartite-type tricarboxylate transporter receptor subunit TctC
LSNPIFKILSPVLLALAALSAGAQSYPERPIRFIIPSGPGINIDVLYRLAATEAANTLGKPLVVENLAGAGGRIGLGQLTRAKPDGYTISAVTAPYAVFGPLGDPSYEFAVYKHYDPLMRGFEDQFLLWANPKAPFRSPAQFLAYAKSNPGKLNLATGGMGTAGHLAFERFRALLGIDVLAVHYKATGPAVTDVVAGRADIIVQAVGSMRGYADQGRVVPIMSFSTTRSEYYPEVPTVAEAGLPGYEMQIWTGIIAPHGTPAEIVERLNQAFISAFRSPALRRKLEEGQQQFRGGTPQDFGRIIQSDTERWRPVFEKAGLRLSP